MSRSKYRFEDILYYRRTPLNRKELRRAARRYHKGIYSELRGGFTSMYCPRCEACGYTACCPAKRCNPGPGCVNLYTIDERAIRKVHAQDEELYYSILAELDETDEMLGVA